MLHVTSLFLQVNLLALKRRFGIYVISAVGNVINHWLVTSTFLMEMANHTACTVTSRNMERYFLFKYVYDIENNIGGVIIDVK